MTTKTSTQVKQELDDLLYESTVDDAPWTAAVKRRALNRAIRGSFPNFKQMKIDTASITLAANTYRYALSALTDLEPFDKAAIMRVSLQPSASDTDDDWMILRRCAQEFDGTHWQLHIPPDIADSYAGQKLALYYYTRLPELTFDGYDTLPAQFVNYVVYAAAADLIRRFMQGGSDFNVDLYPQLLAEYRDKAERELQRNTVLPIACLVAPRREGDL